MTQTQAPHRWRFFRAGAVDQVRLERGSDILHLEALDLKLWVALSCPTKGLEFDARTLEILDVDRDGTVRAGEILAAVKWLRSVLRNGDGLVRGTDRVELASLRDDTEEGRRVLAAARFVLNSLGKSQEHHLCIDDAVRVSDIFANAKWNGDGIVPPESMDDPALAKVAAEAIAAVGGRKDRSGRDGIDAQCLEQFLAECEAFSNWHAEAERNSAAVFPMGADTAASAAALEAVRAKVDDYFGRCRLAAFDGRAIHALNREETAFLALAAKDMSIDAQEVADFPLTRIAAGQPLSLTDGLNPAWTGAISQFRAHCCPQAVGLTEPQWEQLRTRFDAHRAWLGAKAGAKVESLGLQRVREILASGVRARLQKLIDADLATADEVGSIEQVEKLVRLHRHFHTLLQNFVNFADFYARKGAIFQAGRLYLDGRACDLTFVVHDPAKHGTLAVMARTYLAYVECRRPGEAKMTVACAFTAGNCENLFVGRNGVFYDRRGRDWDATITRIVDHPISIGQAFLAPYKKLVRWVEEQVAKRAAAADAEATAKVQSAVVDAGTAAEKSKAAPTPAAGPKKMDIGVLAAISVAISGITAIFGSLLQSFFGLGYLMPLGALGVVLAISGPSMLIAWMKLRQRNLGPVLDANGWAVNSLTRINIPLGRTLTGLAQIPEGSERSYLDPYAEKKPWWPRLLVAAVTLALAGAVLHRTGRLSEWFPDVFPPAVSSVFDGPDSAQPGTRVVIRLKVQHPLFVVTDSKGRASAMSPTPEGTIEIEVPADAAPGSVIVVEEPTSDEMHEIVVKPGK